MRTDSSSAAGPDGLFVRLGQTLFTRAEALHNDIIWPLRVSALSGPQSNACALCRCSRSGRKACDAVLDAPFSPTPYGLSPPTPSRETNQISLTLSSSARRFRRLRPSSSRFVRADPALCSCLPRNPPTHRQNWRERSGRQGRERRRYPGRGYSRIAMASSSRSSSMAWFSRGSGPWPRASIAASRSSRCWSGRHWGMKITRPA